MQGDDALSSTAALTFSKFVAKSADNLAMKRRSGGRQFKSVLLHISVSRFLEMSENRSKSARVRAICAHARTRRTSQAALIARNRQPYPHAILLGPWIIAVDSPGAGTPDYPRALSTFKVIAGAPAVVA